MVSTDGTIDLFVFVRMGLLFLSTVSRLLSFHNKIKAPQCVSAGLSLSTSLPSPPLHSLTECVDISDRSGFKLPIQSSRPISGSLLNYNVKLRFPVDDRLKGERVLIVRKGITEVD